MIKSASFHTIIVRILKDYWHYLHQLTKLKNNFISYPVFYKKILQILHILFYICT